MCCLNGISKIRLLSQASISSRRVSGCSVNALRYFQRKAKIRKFAEPEDPQKNYSCNKGLVHEMCRGPRLPHCE